MMSYNIMNETIYRTRKYSIPKCRGPACAYCRLTKKVNTKFFREKLHVWTTCYLQQRHLQIYDVVLGEYMISYDIM